MSGLASAASAGREMLGAARPEDDRDALVREQPREREGGRVAAPLERLERVVDAVVAQVLVRAGAQRHPRALGRRRVTAVLAGQPAAHERAVHLEPEAVLRAERQHLLLHLAIEQRVRVLDGGEGAGVERLPQLRAVDVAEAVGADLPGGDELLEDARELGGRDVRIRRVREIEVDALDAEPLEARVDLPPHPSRSETVILALGHRVERLGRDPEPVRLPRANPLADVRLAASAAVGVGGVEPRDARLPGRVHELERLLQRLALAEEGGRRADPAEIATTEDQRG